MAIWSIFSYVWKDEVEEVFGEDTDAKEIKRFNEESDIRNSKVKIDETAVDIIKGKVVGITDTINKLDNAMEEIKSKL